MADFDVELEQLETVCNYFLETDYPYFLELREAFWILKYCGCRFQELFDITRWTFINDYTFTLQPQKNNLPRTVILGPECDNFKTCVINQTQPFLGRTYSQLQYLFLKLCPWTPIYSGGREITTYVYRYFYIRSLKASGLSNTEIMNIMGHRSETPILLYLAAVINSTYYIEPTINDSLPTDHIDLITEPQYFDGVDDQFYLSNPFAGEQISIFVKANSLLTGSQVILGPEVRSGDYKQITLFYSFLSNAWTFSLSFVGRYTTTSFQMSWSTKNVQEIPVVMTLDFSQIGSSGGLYRDISGKIYTGNNGTGSSVVYNKLLSANFRPQVLIGAWQYPLNTYQYKFKGTMLKVLTWNRILSSEEIAYMLTL